MTRGELIAHTREKARAVAEEAIGGHYYVDEDCWYSCGAHPECCNEEARAKGCTCNRARRVEALTGAILTLLEDFLAARV